MSRSGGDSGLRDIAGYGSFALLALLLVVLGLESTAVAPALALLGVAAGLATAVALRLVPGASSGAPALLPVVAVLAFVSLVVPVTVLNELLVGLAALVTLLWLATGSGQRALGAPRRATDLLLLPALGFAIALGASLLIPPGELRVGVASLLLVAAIVLIAIVLSRPEALRRSDPASERVPPPS